MRLPGLRWWPLLAAAPLLGGCIAAAALPVLAGGVLVTKARTGIRAAVPRPLPSPAVAAIPRPAVVFDPAAATGAVRLTGLTELPQPDPAASAPDPWRSFLAYAGEHGAAAARGEETRSALLAAPSLELPKLRRCARRDPAVLIDLDPARGSFAPPADALAPAGLAAGLASLRAAGIAVVWISQAPASAVAAVGESLRAAGLDPDGRDPLLLIRSGEDRKQSLREAAGEDVCIVAIAGDDKADFDELFQYLRTPDAATGLDSLLGAGWFLVPPPLVDLTKQVD